MPTAYRLSHRYIKKYGLSQSEIEEVYGELQLKLWEYTIGFRWHDYFVTSPEHAVAAFISYINTAFQSFSISADFELISVDIEDIISEVSVVDVYTQPEVYVILKERQQQILTALYEWYDTETELNINTLIQRYVHEIPVFMLAETLNVTKTSIKRRLARAKRSLYHVLHKHGLTAVIDSPSTKDTRYNHNTRQELLEDRRQLLMRRYDGMKPLLPPKVAQAVEVFYGLNGADATFSYQETAEVLGMSLEAVRVYVPQGVRLVLGIEKVSQRSVEVRRKRQLYIFWLDHQNSIGIQTETAELLKLYFESNYSIAETAKMLNMSTETARRRINTALNIIKRYSAKFENNFTALSV